MVDVVIPISVSGVWRPFISERAEQSGSVGITVILEPYSFARVTQGEGVYLNGNLVKMKNIEYLEARMGKVRVEIESGVPLGFGYGMSASISLAYALGASQIKGLELEHAVLMAHESEVISGNGLGDVVSQFFGRNIVYRERPGFPPHGKIRILDIFSEDIYSKPLEMLPTKSILQPLDISLVLIDEFLSNPSLIKFFEVSRKFTEALGFRSPYPNSFRKKGLILKLGKPESDTWIKHRIASRGAYVE
ncbi:GHMP kinase [Metallosphaera javensis (ex Sakai et al. 2022)]|uniref:GHMP family kinase ATP-binding protein n=1 Tax=Metallosphaera javensis (ex Sakai et al. 2022) TaxID=2775498 RepID=UPI00258430A3|nr:MAG: pantoate kinase [Metallosphaera javensis (ex Sakai et al. 2022)]